MMTPGYNIRLFCTCLLVCCMAEHLFVPMRIKPIKFPIEFLIFLYNDVNNTKKKKYLQKSGNNIFIIIMTIMLLKYLCRIIYIVAAVCVRKPSIFFITICRGAEIKYLYHRSQFVRECHFLKEMK